MFRFIGRAITQIGAEADEEHGHVRGAARGDDLADGVVVLGDDILPPHFVTAIGRVAASVVEAGVDVGAELPAIGRDGGRGACGGAVAEERLADEINGVERIHGALEPGPKGGARLERVVGTVLEEFVVARGDDDEVGLIVQDLLHHRGDAIAGVGHPAAVDRLPGARWIPAGELELQPLRKRRLAGVGMAIDGRTTEAKHAETAARFFRGKFLRCDKRCAGAGGAVDGALTLEEWKILIKSGERIGGLGRPADVAQAEARFECDERQQAREHCEHAKPPPS